MDSRMWKVVYHVITKVDKQMSRFGRKPTYTDRQIVAMYMWSVEHDRPLCWACARENYGRDFRPRKLPSVSQFCKRIKTDRCQAILQKVHERLACIDTITDLSFVDGRALRVGPCSKDRDARRGPIPGGMAKGYKLHAWATEDARIPIWSVMPLNVNEKTVSGELLRFQRAAGFVLADQNYDAGWLYDRVAEDGGQLLTPLPRYAGRGHRPQSAARMHAVGLWKSVAGYVYRERLRIERLFAHQSAYGGGLGPLPAWVRGLERVRRWVGAKLILYHARLWIRKVAS